MVLVRITNGFLGRHVLTTCPGSVVCFFIQGRLRRNQLPIDLVSIDTVTAERPPAYNRNFDAVERKAIFRRALLGQG